MHSDTVINNDIYLLSQIIRGFSSRAAGGGEADSLQVIHNLPRWLESKVRIKRIQNSHLAVHLTGHLCEGGAVSELGVLSYEGEDGFSLNEEQLPPVT